MTDKVINVRSYTRRVKAKKRAIDNDTSIELWDWFLGTVLTAELARRLAEPLDELDAPEWQKQRMRETY